MRKILLLSFTVIAVITASAQDFSNKGKDFWVGYGYHAVMTGGNTQDMLLYFATDQVTTVTVDIPGLGYTITYPNIPANTVYAIPTPMPKSGPFDSRLLTESTSPEGKGIHITSDKAIVAYAHVYNGSVSGATILYPTNTLGKEYYSVNYENISNSDNANCWMYVVASDTGTTVVEITPSVQTLNHAAGVPFTVSLTQGQIYNIMATYDNVTHKGGDLTGSKIKSLASANGGCKKIAVFSGSGRINIGCGNTNGSSDNYMVQDLPKTAWGKNYLTVPSAGYNNVATGAPYAYNLYRICVLDPLTVVKLDGVVLNPATLVSGFYYQVNQTNLPHRVESDLPIMVAQYLPSRSLCNNPGPAGDGDPEVIYLSPIEQSISTVRWLACRNSAINPNKHYINVVIPNTGTAISSLILDGAPVAAGNFIPHPQLAGYSYAVLNVTGSNFPPGVSHFLQSDSGFNAIAYGYGSAESYGYNAGTNVRDLYQQVGVSTTYGIETTPSVCSGAPFKFKVSLPYCADSIKWDLSMLPGPPAVPATQIYSSCAVVVGGPDSITTLNGKQIYWYSLPATYIFSNTGSFPVNIKVYNTANLDGCGNVQQIDFDLQVSDPPVADFSWTPGGCVAEPYQFTETTPQTPKPTYKWWWNFGDGSPVSTLRNPTHTFTGPGTYNVRYSSVTTPGCLSDTIVHQIVVPDLPNATIGGNATVCINAAQPSVTFTGSLGTAPYTFTYTINGGPQLTVNSAVNTATVLAPTNVAGPFVYNLIKVQNVGSTLCTRNIAGQSVTVNITPDATIALTSAIGTNSQTVCINNPIINITYAIGGSGTGGTVTGLPAGVTGTFAGGVVTITGTPTVNGSFSYTVNTTGPCVKPSATGTINVTADATIALTSAVGSDDQTLCINTPLLINITYAVAGSGTGGSVTGLPAGVTGIYSAGVITISGTPSASGVFNYTVNTTGPCIKPSATGKITVTADGTLTLTSAAGTNNQSRCINTAITTITYSVGGSGTGGSVTGLPTGVTGVFAGGIITIAGTPTSTVGSPFTYTVTTTGPCVKPTATGTITVNPDATINLTSAPPTTAQELCRNATISNITYAIAGGGTGATVTGLPTGVNGVYAAGIFTISGTPSVAGTFNYTVNTTGTCVQTNATGSIIVNQLPTANFNYTTPSCETRLINFTDASVANSGVLNTWLWNFGDGSATASTQNTSHVYPMPGTYNVTLSVSTDKGCTSLPIASIPVTINYRPQAGFTVPEVCINDVAAVFTDTSKIAVGTINPAGYEWDFGDGSPKTFTKDGTHLYLATGVYQVMHVVTSTLGCKDTIVQPITINGANPVADFAVNNPATLCANDSVGITNLSSVNFGNVTKLEIYWDNIGMPAVKQTDDNPVLNKVYKHLYPNFQSPLTKNFSVRVLAYSGTLCVSQLTRVITVNAAPKVQFNNMPDACLLAIPFQITQASEVGGVPGTGTYSGAGVSPTGIFSPLVAGIGTHTIRYTFTSSAAGCVDTISNTIKVLDTAHANFSFVSPICEGNAASFTEQSTAPASVTLTNTTWNFGDGTPAENHLPGTTFTHTFPAAGTFIVTMYNTSAYGCLSTSHVLPVTVSPAPVPGFAVDKPNYCLPNAVVKFNNSSSIANATALTYLWDFGEPSSPNNSSTALNPSHQYAGTGPYNVTLHVVSNVGCFHDTIIQVKNIHPQPKADFTFNKPGICIGDNVTITDNSDGKDGTINQWNWDLGDGTTRNTNTFTYTFTDTLTYNVKLYSVNSFGCNSDTLVKPFTVYPYPHVDAGPDRFILEGGTITLEPVTYATNAQYLWTPNLYLIDNRIARVKVDNPLTDMTYTLTVTNGGGCPASDDVFVKLLKFPIIPNTFTPNNDGINDFWRIDYLNTYPNNRVQIFTRSGQLVFESRGYNTPWDGTLKGKALPIDTYYYIIEPGNGRDPITGYVTILK